MNYQLCLLYYFLQLRFVFKWVAQYEDYFQFTFDHFFKFFVLLVPLDLKRQGSGPVGGFVCRDEGIDEKITFTLFPRRKRAKDVFRREPFFQQFLN